MAFVEQRGKWYRVIFRYAGRRYTHTLKTTSRKHADILKGGIERTLMLLQQRLLQPPEDVDIVSFVLGNGQSKDKNNGALTQPPQPLTLEQLRERYVAAHSLGTMETNSLNTAAMHLRHFENTLGKRFVVQTLALSHLQTYVETRSRKKGLYNRPLSPVTLRKEVATFRAAWNWAMHMSLVRGSFPNRGLKYPKDDDKPPFQTWEQIDHQIALGGLSDAEHKELWRALFLTLPEIDAFLAFVKGKALHGFLYPMCFFAAHTGARRSEMLRLRWQDIDLGSRTAVLHERKRDKHKRTTRRVPLSARLVQVLAEWRTNHPGGPYVFCHALHVARSKKPRTDFIALTRDEANDHFQRLVAGSRWEKLRGWHVFRHSFVSNCAAKGIDQRMIDEWVGHQTEEMRRRYRHLIPGQQQQAIGLVFGPG